MGVSCLCLSNYIPLSRTNVIANSDTNMWMFFLYRFCTEQQRRQWLFMRSKNRLATNFSVVAKFFVATTELIVITRVNPDADMREKFDMNGKRGTCMQIIILTNSINSTIEPLEIKIIRE